MSVLLVREDLAEPLSAVGRVAWTDGTLAGIQFAERSAPVVAAWFDRLLASRPALRNEIDRVPDELSAAAALVRTGVPAQPDLRADEAALLACVVDDRSPIVAVLGRTALPAERARAALFGLLQKGLVRITARSVAQRTLDRVAPAPHGLLGRGRAVSGALDLAA